MADDGLTVVFYSTDLEEVMELADRIVTVYRGRIVRNLACAATNPNEVLKDILHGVEEVFA
jgi:ribose transport system ATP-binding protein